LGEPRAKGLNITAAAIKAHAGKHEILMPHMQQGPFHRSFRLFSEYISPPSGTTHPPSATPGLQFA
jgi:hypothetical protein